MSKLVILTIRPRQEDCWFGVYNIPSFIGLYMYWFSMVNVRTHFQTCPRPAAVAQLPALEVLQFRKFSRSIFCVHMCVHILNLVCDCNLGYEEITDIRTLSFR